ncbi:hypothetical protein CB1_000146002 [Camelus ferus]|nr:hypothetical protein CB1_000146002 [Camelus ferus]
MDMDRGSSTTLQQRTPSCEAAPHRDPLEPIDSARVDAAAKGEWWGQAPCCAEHLTIPNFAFEPLDMGGLSGDLFFDGGHSAAPEPRASSSGATEPQQTETPTPPGDPSRGGTGASPHCPLGPPEERVPPATSTLGDSVDKPV